MKRAEDAKGWLEAQLEDREFRRSYAREDLIEEFLHQVEEAMDRRGVSRRQLAALLGCSAANVTRIMRRTGNLTAATMADLAFALDLRLRIDLEPMTDWTVGPYLEHVTGAQAEFVSPGAAEALRGIWEWPMQQVRLSTAKRGNLPVVKARQAQVA
jgi:transcriptional regulator with XRE-family HTH domain